MWYLPDFWLPRMQCWVEIKPKPRMWSRELLQSEDYTKARRLAVRTRMPVYIFVGPVGPWKIDLEIVLRRYLTRTPYGDETTIDTHYCLPEGVVQGPAMWGECASCHEFGIGFLGRPGHRSSSFVCSCGEAGASPDCDSTPRLLASYAAARGARFEHGERPWTE